MYYYFNYGNYIKKSIMYIIVFFLLLCLNSFAADERAKDIFTQNKNKILAEKLLLINGYYFSVGISLPEDKGHSSSIVVEKSSVENAVNNTYRLIADNINWPESISKKIYENILIEYAKFCTLKKLASEYYTVDKGKTSGGYSYTVISIPVRFIKQPRIDYKDIYSTLNNAFLEKKKNLNYVIFLEICSDSQIKNVLRMIASSPEYKSNSKAVILGKKAPLFPNTHWLKEINLRYLNKLNTMEMINLLEAAPYFPILCWKIGGELRKHGLNRNAQIFYSAGTKWPISRKYNHLCREKVVDNYFIDRSKHNSYFTYELIERIKTILKKTKIPIDGNSQLIVDSLGLIPVKGNNVADECKVGNKIYFAKNPNLMKALDCFQQGIQKSVSAENCNMLGNCFYYLGHREIALPFFLQALEISPRYKDALINTALVYNFIAKPDLAFKFALRAEKVGNLSSWEKEQINDIIYQSK